MERSRKSKGLGVNKPERRTVDSEGNGGQPCCCERVLVQHGCSEAWAALVVGPDRGSPSVSAEAENPARLRTDPDSAPFSRRLAARGSFSLAHKTNSSASRNSLSHRHLPPSTS